MIDALMQPAVEWLAASGAPNWVVLVALLTSPWTWTRLIRERLSTVASKVGLGGE